MTMCSECGGQVSALFQVCKTCQRVDAEARYAKAHIKRALKISRRHAERHGHACLTASREEVAELAKVHGGKCMVPGCSRFWYMIDHDRATGRMRGLLCIQCMTMLEMVNSNPHFLQSMRQYVILSGGGNAE